MAYVKINSFKRDMENQNCIMPVICDPEVEFLKDMPWVAEEKIDGTCICIQFDFVEGKSTYSIKGHHEKSEIPPKLMKCLVDIANKIKPDMERIFGYHSYINIQGITEIKNFTGSVILYGEGYGLGIQKVGKHYLADRCDFIMFDYDVNGRYGTPHMARDLAEELGIKFVPIVREAVTISEAVEIVKNGFHSYISENPELVAEGLVLKNGLGLTKRDGTPLLIKIKFKDLNMFKIKNPNKEFKI